MKDNMQPPKILHSLIAKITRSENQSAVLGDIEEEFLEIALENGIYRAKFWYLKQFLKSILPILIFNILWSSVMLKNYIKIAFRNIKRHKGYSFINIAGLALGLTVFLLSSLWVGHELSFDRFHEHSASIYKLNTTRAFSDHLEHSARTPGPVGPALAQNFSEIREAARTAWTGERVMRYDDKIFYENGILTVDDAFSRIFSFNLVKGKFFTESDDIFSIVISQSTAEKYFGVQEALGKVISMDARLNFKVIGVIEDVPHNSSIQFDMLVPFEIVQRLGWDIESWDFSLAVTYLLLQENIDINVFSSSIADFVKKHDEQSNIELTIQALNQIHLYSNFDNADGLGLIQYVYGFSILGILILLIACINFINLTTARSEHRAKEIGIRKTAGALRKQLIHQFLSESLVIAFLALLLSPILIFLVLPLFNSLTEQSFQIKEFAAWPYLLTAFTGTIFTGLLSGSYPAFLLSSAKPVQVLKGRISQRIGTGLLRKTLVVIQLSASVIFIVISLAVYQQLDYLQNKELGFDKEHVVSVPLGISNLDNSQTYQRLKNEIQNLPGIENISASFTHPSWFATPTDKIFLKGRQLDKSVPISITSVEFGFIETLKIHIIEGRSFSETFGTERSNIIVNESFTRLMGEENVLGQVISIGDGYDGTIVGVMKDFHHDSPANTIIGPLIIFCHPGVNYIHIRVKPELYAVTMNAVEKAWNKIKPDFPFQFNPMDETYTGLYKDVEILNKAIEAFTLIACIIACLGLFGMASFAAEKRKKEIGVRKVLGASTSRIAGEFLKDFIKWAVLANLFAWPVSWFLMDRWLQNFAYRTELGLNVFLLAGTIGLMLTLITISFQVFRAAGADPVNALKYE